MGYTSELHSLLEVLIDELNNLNGVDKLEGKLNELVVSMNLNKQLEELDLPKLQVFNEYPISVTYKEESNIIEVFHPASEELLFKIPVAEAIESTGDEQTIRFLEDLQEGFVDNERLQVWVETEYTDILDTFNF